MPRPFFERLTEYYLAWSNVLKGEASIASIFPNTTDIGMSREQTYAEFLKKHLPSACNVLFGGFLFNNEGFESRQIDLIVINDVAPQYALPSGTSIKSFASVDGAIAIVSVKSNLTSAQLIDSLDNIASIPPKEAMGNRCNPLLRITQEHYDECPCKIVYATDGAELATIMGTLNDYYVRNSQIPFHMRPNIIHVIGKYSIIRVGSTGGVTRDGTTISSNTFWPHSVPTHDAHALLYTICEIQGRAQDSRHLLYSYASLVDSLVL